MGSCGSAGSRPRLTPIARCSSWSGPLQPRTVSSLNQGLAHNGGATRDVYAALPGRLTRLCVSGVEAAGDEVEDRPAIHLGRLASVMGEHKHRRVVRRLGAPPAAPVLIPDHVLIHQG